MKRFLKPMFRGVAIVVLFSFLFQACAPSKQLYAPEVKKYSSVKVYTKDGQTLEGIVLKHQGNEIILVSESDHKPHTIALKDIRRMERSDKVYDYHAYPISEAEIEKYKGNRNMWGYALGGGAISGLGGIVVALPFWRSEVISVPPYFVGGIAAVVGSIYFARKGMKKDYEQALEVVRYAHLRQRQLEAEKRKEEERLKKIEEEKQKILKKLEKKKQKEGQQRPEASGNEQGNGGGQ